MTLEQEIRHCDKTTFKLYDTTISVAFSDNIINSEKLGGIGPNGGGLNLWHKTLSFLGSIGFYVAEDKEIKKNYSCLSPYHRYGKYADLKFKSKSYRVGFEIVFYQDENHENSHGGYYDLDKRQKMPYLIEKQLQLTYNKLKEFFKTELNFAEKTSIIAKTAEEKVKKFYVESVHKPFTNMDFSLSDKWIMKEEPKSYNGHDKNGHQIHNGDFKYCYDFKGVLHRGKVYHDINATWFMCIDKKNVIFAQATNLFNYDNSMPRRKALNSTPQAYLMHREELTKATTKELVAELKRRKNCRI